MFHDKTATAAKGKWRGILLTLGLPDDALKDRHGPCPMCGGINRFRWDNKDGNGTYLCNQCGAGDGMKLAVQFLGKPFSDVAAQIDGIIGNLTPDTARPKAGVTEADRLQILRKAWAETKPLEPADLGHKYLESRGLGEMVYPPALRFGAAMKDGDGGVRPCLLAMVGVFGEPKYATMHRTFLRPDGLAKAEMTAPRKLMPGSLPDGACVQLSTYTSGPLGIAEGIETAMSASAIYGLPVWAAINSANLTKWLPPAGCNEVVIFGDHDPMFGGQAAAYTLAHKISVKKSEVTVQIPPIMGQDWNDVWVSRAKP